ncbi:hypothetical protein TWF173_004628 [Orbilia oligospora]|nr:hypothetical protein TWF173_004628 [Orbilia oligospora]
MEMQVDTQPIYLMAHDCRELFDKILDAPSPPRVARLIREYQERFNAWTSFLGVFAGEDACLDHRLRNHSALQDMIIRLLDVLRRNLFLVSVDEEAKIRVSIDVPNSPVDPTMKGIQSPIPTIAFSSIEETITRLNKLGITIKLSSRSTATARARTFVSQNPDLVSLSEFEDKAYLALQSLYPNAYEGIRQQLVDSMADSETYPNSSVDALAPSARGEGELVELIVESSTNEDATVLTQENRPIVVKFPASSIETSRLHANLGGSTPNVPQSKSPKTLTIHTNRPREPPVPIFDNDEDYTNCIWCFQMIDRSVLHTRANGHTEWSNEGRTSNQDPQSRRHYCQDLQPYVCIAASCSKLRPTYSSSREWFNHMVSAHSECWSQNLHNKSLLTCLAGHDNNSAYIFSTRDGLFNHNILHHNHIEELNIGKGDDERAEDYAIEGATLAPLCPLCFFRVETDLTHEEKGMDDYMSPDETSQGQLKRICPHKQSEKRVKYSPNTTRPKEIVTSWAMGSHIAEHLHYLMVVSLQLMSAIDGEPCGKDDTKSILISNSSSSFISEPGNEVKNKLEDLPSDLMGSFDWTDPEDEILDSPKPNSFGLHTNPLPGYLYPSFSKPPNPTRRESGTPELIDITIPEPTYMLALAQNPDLKWLILKFSSSEAQIENTKIEISTHEYYNLLRKLIRKGKTPFGFRKRTLETMAKRLGEKGQEIREGLGLSQDDLVGLAMVSLYDIYFMCSDGESMKMGSQLANLLCTLQSVSDWAARLGQGISLRFINTADPADSSWDGLGNQKRIRDIFQGLWPQGKTPLAQALQDKIFDPIIRNRFSIDSFSRREGEVKPAIVAIITDGEPTDLDDSDTEHIANITFPDFSEFGFRHFRNNILRLINDLPTGSIIFIVFKLGESSGVDLFLDRIRADEGIKDMIHCSAIELTDLFASPENPHRVEFPRHNIIREMVSLPIPRAALTTIADC